jgi:hypothetical protein
VWVDIAAGFWKITLFTDAPVELDFEQPTPIAVGRQRN